MTRRDVDQELKHNASGSRLVLEKIAVDRRMRTSFMRRTLLSIDPLTRQDVDGIKGAPGGDDYHQLWIYPDDPKRMVLAAIRRDRHVDGARRGVLYNQSTAQIYHVAADRRIPYGSPARNRTARGRSPRAAGIRKSPIAIGKACAPAAVRYTAPDPLHPEFFWRYRLALHVVTGETKNVTPERGAVASLRPTGHSRCFLASRSHALITATSSVQDDERRRELDADQPGRDARRSGVPST